MGDLKLAFYRMEEAKANMLVSRKHPTLASDHQEREECFDIFFPICSSSLVIFLSNAGVTSNFKSQANGSC